MAGELPRVPIAVERGFHIRADSGIRRLVSMVQAPMGMKRPSPSFYVAWLDLDMAVCENVLHAT
jgi:hypothetical protein